MFNNKQIAQLVKDILPFAENHKTMKRTNGYLYTFDLAGTTHVLEITEHTTSVQLVTALASLAEDYWVAYGMKYFDDTKHTKYTLLQQTIRKLYERTKNAIRKLRTTAAQNTRLICNCTKSKHVN